MTIEDVKAEIVRDAAEARRGSKKAESDGDLLTSVCMEWSARAMKRILDMLCDIPIPAEPEGGGAHMWSETERVCPKCGKHFLPGWKNQKYCSGECREASKLERMRKADKERRMAEKERRAEDKKRTARRKKKQGDIVKDDMEAKRLGISYGQLQARRYLEEMAKKDAKKRDRRRAANKERTVEK